MAVRTVDFLEAVSFAADLAMGLPGEHAARCCYLASSVASELGVDEEERADVYFAALLTDAGCTAWTSQLAAYVLGDEIAARRALFFSGDFASALDTLGWIARYVGRRAPARQRISHAADLILHGERVMREGFRNSIEVAQRFASRLGMPPGVCETLRCAFERWDGKGMPVGIAGEDIPLAAAIVHASLYLEVCQQRGGVDLAREIARNRRGSAFSPIVVDAFLAVTERDGFWEPLDSLNVWSAVRSIEPSSRRIAVPEDGGASVSACLADFTDMKVPHTAGHSRRVASLGRLTAERLGLSAADVAEIEFAGLVHDVGRVAIPSFVLGKPPGERSAAEVEAVRLHPHHSERILLRLPGHERVAAIAAAHHEHVDGSGYPRGLAGDQIPFGARIVAAADRFDELTHASPGCGAIPAVDALAAIRSEVGTAFDRAVVDALAAANGGPGLAGAEERADEAGSATSRWPGGLTNREVEVLRLAARGLTRRQVAARLVVSESTVRAHLEHIYAKIEVSTRAAAALFAMEHGLLE